MMRPDPICAVSPRYSTAQSGSTVNDAASHGMACAGADHGGLNAAAGRVKRAADHLQQRGFTTAIAPDDTDSLAFLNIEGDVPERPKLPIGFAWVVAQPPVAGGAGRTA